MANYEIREDSSNKYWPFQVFNLTEDRMVNGRFAKREDAQHWIDTIDKVSEPDLYLFNAFFGDELEGTDTVIQPGSKEEATYNRQKAEWEAKHPIEDRTTTPVSPAVPNEEECFVEDKAHKVGDRIKDEHGNEYIVIEDSWYVSAADAEDAEDANDVSLPVGWYTNVRLASPSTQVLIEQVQTGQAEIVRRGGVTCVQFKDEDQPIPLNDLAYSGELGLYQKSKFPEVR